MWINVERIRNPDAHIGQYHWLGQETFTLMLKLVQGSNPAGAIGVNLVPAAPRVAGSLCRDLKEPMGYTVMLCWKPVHTNEFYSSSALQRKFNVYTNEIQNLAAAHSIL